jgi:hypothetical protein
MKVKTNVLYCAVFLLIFSRGFYSCMGPVPVDIVMADNELFFVLEEKQEISAVRVFVHHPGAGARDRKTVWALSHDLTTEVENRKYPLMKQIQYGQSFEEFPVVTGPFELQKNVEYVVGIDMRDKFARETFIITDDNKAIMAKPVFERQKGRRYSVSVDKDGNKTLSLEPVSKKGGG